MGVKTTAEGPTSNTESFTLMALTFQRRWHHRHKKTSPPLRALSACKTVLWTSATPKRPLNPAEICLRSPRWRQGRGGHKAVAAAAGLCGLLAGISLRLSGRTLGPELTRS